MKVRIQEIMQELEKIREEVSDMGIEEKDNSAIELLYSAEFNIMNAITDLNKYWES